MAPARRAPSTRSLLVRRSAPRRVPTTRSTPSRPALAASASRPHPIRGADAGAGPGSTPGDPRPGTNYTLLNRAPITTDQARSRAMAAALTAARRVQERRVDYRWRSAGGRRPSLWPHAAAAVRGDPRRAQDRARGSFDAHWQELADYFLPRRTRFTTWDKPRREAQSGDHRQPSHVRLAHAAARAARRPDVAGQALVQAHHPDPI